MRTGSAILATTALLVAVRATAVDVELGVELGTEYDSNVTASSVNEENDFSLRAGPRLRVTDETGALQWELRYWPRYRKMLDLSELDGWDHDAYGNVRWSVTPRTTVTLTDRFVDYAGFDSILTENLLPDGSIDTGFDLNRRRVQQNYLEAAVSHVLSRRSVVDFSVNWWDNRFERPELEDVTSEVYGADASYSYSWSARDEFGVVARVTRQSVQQSPDLPERDTDFYNLSLQWLHLFDPSLRLSAVAGPTWVERDLAEIPEVFPGQRQFPSGVREDGTIALVRASTCPRRGGAFEIHESCRLFDEDTPLPTQLLATIPATVPFVGDDPRDSGDLTYFATIALDKNWGEKYFLTLRYLRDATTTTEVSGAVRDSFSINLLWLPHERWRITFNVTYEQREEPSENLTFRGLVEPTTVFGVDDVASLVGIRAAEVNDVFQTESYLAGVFLKYTLSRRAWLFANFYYTRSELNNELLDSRTIADRYRIAIGIVYTFPRFQLPI